MRLEASIAYNQFKAGRPWNGFRVSHNGGRPLNTTQEAGYCAGRPHGTTRVAGYVSSGGRSGTTQDDGLTLAVVNLMVPLKMRGGMMALMLAVVNLVVPLKILDPT